MAKSIRSKCKRKARAEFRNTIGTDFYQKNMTKVQEKLKECLDKQTMSMDSLERLSNAFQTTNTSTSCDELEESVNMTDIETSSRKLSEEQLLKEAKELKGENLAPKEIHKKSKKRKHSVPSAGRNKELKQKRRPRYFVQF